MLLVSPYLFLTESPATFPQAFSVYFRGLVKPFKASIVRLPSAKQFSEFAAPDGCRSASRMIMYSLIRYSLDIAWFTIAETAIRAFEASTTIVRPGIVVTW